ncbi:MAG: hypothetical protein K2Y30_15560 [Flavobacteriaceae bacterium]|nr:hypothetical protein [Flavobacteriaceae bacterium]
MGILKWFFSSKDRSTKEMQNEVNINNVNLNVEREAICPYCNALLNKIPIRKTKCPHCKNSIFVRKSNDSKIKTFVTEKQAQEIDIEREKEYLKYRGFPDLEKFGVTKDEFIKRKEEYYLKYGIENNNNDVVWSLFNELLIKNANDVDKLRIIYYTMAVLLHQEGKDNFKLLQLSAKATLDSFQLCGFEFKVEILGSSDSCDACKKLNGKIISIEEAYLLPIPCRECTHRIGFCRCFFGLIAIRDKDGMLLLKQ